MFTNITPIFKAVSHLSSCENVFLPDRPAFNVITDIALAIFPATFLWNLNMQLQKKIGLMSVMGLDVLSASAQPSFKRS